MQSEIQRLQNELTLTQAQLAREREVQKDQAERSNLDAHKFELLIDMVRADNRFLTF